MRLLLLFFILCPVLVTGQNIEGYWTGSIDVQGISLRLAFTINVSGDTLLTTMDSPDQEVFGIPVQSTYTNGDTLRFEMPNASIKYEGVLDSSGRYIGMFNQGGMAFPLNLEKTEEKQLGNKRPQEPKKPYPYSEEMVVFLNETDGIKLAGTLTIPKEQASYPAVVLISGSGAQNRDEAILGHKPFLVLADHLTRNGIAVLRYDDRGTAESEGDFTSSTAYDFSKDAEAAFNYLKSRKEIDSNRIGLIGHSEGGMVAPMVAARNSEINFLVLLAGTGVRGDQIILQQSFLIGKASGIPEEELAKGREINKGAFDLVLDETIDDSLDTKLTQYFYSQDTSITDEGITVEQMVNKNVRTLNNPQIKYFIRYDPAPALKKVTCPVLALNGERDLQVDPNQNINAIRSALEEGGNRKVTTKVFPRLNHLFQECKTGNINEYGSIEQTISPEVLEEISNWIKAIEH